MSNGKALLLTGIDGSNPLGFLAALGTLRTLAHTWPENDVRMRWLIHGGAWRPELISNNEMSADVVLVGLSEALQVKPAAHPLYRTLSDKNRNWDANQPDADWITALTSDLAPKAVSQLQTVRRDYFLGNVESILARTKASHLDRTLFQFWDYADALENQSLHFDPTEDRRHAYQWAKPSGDPDRKKRGGMLGANRLAIEAWPFFQAFPRGDKLQTRGFRGTSVDNTWWTWPLWGVALGESVLHSTLALAQLQEEQPATEALRAIGIAAVFRCRRILVEKTPNFTPARAVI